MKQLLTIFLLLCAMPLFAQAELRVALVPLDDAGRSQADLALAELSDEPDVAFLERAEIDKIRKEVQLDNLNDYFPDPQAMQDTQLFILLKNEQMMAFDSRTGVRLWDCKCKEWPELTAAVRMAVVKQRGFSADTLKKVSVMPMVSAHLDVPQDKLAHQAETLMLQKLCVRQDLVLLERRHLLFLLNEPNAAERKLADQLFAGAVVMRPTAVSLDKGIQLKLQFFSSDGKRCLLESVLSIANAAEMGKILDDYLNFLEIPDNVHEDKQGEAGQFIREAWFAWFHGLNGDALSSGASAAVLDDNYAQELARIAFFSVGRLLAQGSEKSTNLAMDNMRLGAELVERHKGFSKESRHSAETILWNINLLQFEAMTAQQQKEFMAIMERLIVLRKHQLDMEWEQKLKADCPRWPERVFYVETLSQYTQDLHALSYLGWDLSLWRKHVYPAMERFIDAYNDLTPEIERFAHLSLKEILQIVSNPKIKQLRTPSNKQCALMNMHSTLNHFKMICSSRFAYTASQLTSEEFAFREKAYHRMMTSKYLHLACNALDALMFLEFGLEDIVVMNANDENHEALAFYYAELMRIMNNASLTPHYQSDLRLKVPSEGFVKARMEIQDIAVRRLYCSDPFQEMLLFGYEKWPAETAKEVYEKLGEWERICLEALENDELAKESHSQRIKDYFSRQQIKLERQFGFQNEQRLQVPVINPYRHIYSPFSQDKNIYGFVYAGCENNSLFFFANTKGNMLSLQEIVLDSPAQTRQISSIPLPESKFERKFGAVLDDCYAALLLSVNNAWICVFPKNGGQPYVTPVKNYCESSNYHSYQAFCGGGDSLFVSCDGGGGFSGKLVHYNVRTGEAKLIASTIDRSIKWPLQGIDHPYAVHHLICDAENKRIITLLNSKPHPQYGEIVYDMALWAYYWETGEWKAISKFLPCSLAEFDPGLDYISGEFWLGCNFGFGRINKEGNMQPVFVICDNHLSEQTIRYGSPSFDQVVVDLSKIQSILSQYKELKQYWDLRYQACNGKLYWGHKAIMLIDEQVFFRLEDGFQVTSCIGDRYCLGIYNQREYQLRELKSVEEMLAEVKSQHQ